MKAYETVIGHSGDLYIGGTKIGTVEAWQVDFGEEVEFFKGDSKYPVAALSKGRSCMVKAKTKTFDGEALAGSFLGITTATGETLRLSETHAVAGTGPLVLSSAATLVEILEVRDATGQRMTLAASAPTVGQYTNTAGSIGFNASEPAGKVVDYLATAVGGRKAAGTNTPIGKARTVRFRGFNAEIDSARPMGFAAYAVVPTKPGSLGFKLESFQEGMDFEGTAIDPGTGTVWDLFFELT